jgi:hypothetical protein
MSDDELKKYCRDFPSVVRGVLGVEENQLEDPDVNGWLLSVLMFDMDLNQMKRLSGATINEILQQLPDKIESETDLVFDKPTAFVQKVVNQYASLMVKRGSKIKSANKKAPILVRVVVQTIIMHMAKYF